MNNWPRYNWERWKAKRAKELGLRLIVSKPVKRLNDATPEEWDAANRDLRSLSVEQRAAEFIRRHVARTLADDEPGAA